MTDEYHKVSQEIEKANDIVIVGGGATGVELAGEICDKYKMKKLVLIHSSQILVADFSQKFQASLKSGLESLNVELLLEEKVENMTDLSFNVFKRQTLKTSKVNSNNSYHQFKPSLGHFCAVVQSYDGKNLYFDYDIFRGRQSKVIWFYDALD